MGCPVCETAPEALRGAISVHCWIAFGHSSAKLRDLARGAGLEAIPDEAAGSIRIDAEAEA